MQVVQESILQAVYKSRKPTSHKGDFGHLLVIGGSKQYSGAPALVALAALRTGVDAVTVAAPERTANIVAGFAPDLITCPLAGDALGLRHVKDVMALCSYASAVVIGNGMSSHFESKKVKQGRVQLINKLVSTLHVPMVLDADGIRGVAEDSFFSLRNSALRQGRRPAEFASGLKTSSGKLILPQTVLVEKKLSSALRRKERLRQIILTPHVGEFKALTGMDVTDWDTVKRARAVKEYAAKFQSIILLKGHIDVISDGTSVVVNKTGNPYMTKGGTGDVLAGVVGSLLAQGVDPFVATQAAAYIVGRAGDRVAKIKKQALLASDLLEYL